MMRLHAVLTAAALFCCCVVAPAQISAADPWPPADPAEPRAKVELGAGFAMRLRDIRSFRGLQEAAGARGQITEVALEGDAPHVVYSWTGIGKGGRMRALVYRDGDFGAIITPADGAADIVFNNFGAFVCAACSPPVNSCGHRPSWVPHDLHWDIFDCGCTLTGPQSLKAGGC